MNKKIIVLLFFFGLIAPAFAFAEGLDFVNVKTNPKTPGVNEDVTVSLESFSTNLDSSEIIWYVNKDPFKQGVGEKSIVVHTGDFGVAKDIKVVILSNLGKRIEKTIQLIPSEIDFLWEAQTYTPPFYKGKALPTYKSIVKVTAIPRFGDATSDPRMFDYDWKYNKTQGVGHGLGKNSALILMGYPKTSVPVNVTVTLPSNGWSGERSSTVMGGEALVRFYEQAPLLGINFNKALGANTAGTGNQITIKAVPYFFSNDDVADGVLLYNWSVNNRNSVSGLDPTTLFVTKLGTDDEQKADQQFTASLKIQTPRHLLQQGSARTLIDLPEEQR